MRAREASPTFELLRRVHARLEIDAERADTAEEGAYYRELADGVFCLLREFQPGAKLRIVYREVGPDLWELGPEGRTHTALATSAIGARAMHLALSGKSPALSSLTTATHADRVLRDARGITATWAERHGCRELATVARGLEIRAGHVRHVPRDGEPTFVLA